MYLKNLRIRNKLLLISVLPLLFTIPLITASDKMQDLDQAEAGSPILDVGFKTIELIHELQKERGLSSGTVGTPPGVPAKLEAQRALVDSLQKVWRQAVVKLDDEGGKPNTLGAELEKRFDSINQVRKSIDGRSVSVDELLTAYTGAIRAGLETFGAASVHASVQNVSALLVPLKRLLEAKEAAGRERAVLMAVFSKNNATSAQLQQAFVLFRRQRKMLKEFITSANEANRSIFQQKFKGSAIRKVERMRAVLATLGQRTEGLKKLEALTGYGGFVDNVRLFALRGSTLYDEKARAQYQEVAEVMKHLLTTFPESSDGAKHIQTITSTLKQYHEALGTIARLRTDGRSAKQIDRATKIDDGPASASLRALRETAFLDQDPAEWFEASSARINLLRDVRQHMTKTIAEQQDEYAKTSRNTLYLSIGAAALLLGLVAVIVFWVSRQILIPLDQMDGVLSKVRDGVLTGHLEVTSKDEVGRMGESLNTAVSQMRTSIKEISEGAEQLAVAAEEMSANASGVMTRSEMVGGHIEEANGQAGDVTEAATTIAAAVEEMSVTITEISQNTTEACAISQSAVTIVEEASERIQSLDTAGAQIGEVIELIRSIADQTNLLALNATIEAARAGDSGKGFAVVADEVKTLAAQTTRATTEISERILALQAGTRGAVAAIGKIGQIVHDVEEVSMTIASAVEEQAATMNEISQNVSDVARRADQINESMTTVSTAVSESNRQLDELNTVTSELAFMGDSMRALCMRFEI